jgi:hypothetical protein
VWFHRVGGAAGLHPSGHSIANRRAGDRALPLTSASSQQKVGQHAEGLQEYEGQG